MRRSRLILIAGSVCSVAVAIGAGPEHFERTRILVAGSGGPAAIAALAAAVQRQIDAGVAVTTQVDGVSIARRSSPGDGALLDVLAAHAVGAVSAAATAVLAPTLPTPAPHLAIDVLNAQRSAAQSAYDEADRRITYLFAALTGIARDAAAALRLDVTPNGDAPARAMLATVQLRRADLAARYTADFPGIGIADEEIARLQTLLAHAAEYRGQDRRVALAGLHVEQLRVQTALDGETRRRDGLSDRLTGLDTAIAAQLAQSVAPAPAQAPVAIRYTVVDLPATSLPDARPAGLAAIAVVSFAAAWLGRERRRAVPAERLHDQIALIERHLQVPVLRCLDAEGTPLLLVCDAASRNSRQIWL